MKTNRKFKRIFACAMALCLGGSMLLAGCGGETEDPNKDPDDGGKPSTEKEVKSIDITKEPTKVDFFVGDAFSVEGGEITVTYTDGSTEKIAMTAEGVEVKGGSTEIGDPSLDEMDKVVTVRYGGKSDRYNIHVEYQMFDVTFDYNYDEKTEVVEVRKGSPVAEPKDPIRDEYNFNGWYADNKFTTAYNFDTAITADTTIYAQWLEAGTYYEVTFDQNYTFCPVDISAQTIKEGEKATEPTAKPTRYGYDFGGWCTDKEGNTPFSFDTAIEADTTLYAKWTRDTAEVSDGVHEYVFEAENTNLDGKTGPGLSGTASAGGMIQTITTHGASGDQFVGYQYEMGCAITFSFISDRAVNDAKIVLRLSAEYADFTMNWEENRVELNGKVIEYSDIKFENVPNPGGDLDTSRLYALPFEDFVIIENATLVEGMNSVNITTNNNNTLEGTTFKATAPLIDCLKVTTSAILEWARRNNLPKHYT